VNNESGYMVRTKPSLSDEGGVLPGYGVIDSVYLTWGSHCKTHLKSSVFACLSPKKGERREETTLFLFLSPMECL
jgi:hypothetical protein